MSTNLTRTNLKREGETLIKQLKEYIDDFIHDDFLNIVYRTKHDFEKAESVALSEQLVKDGKLDLKGIVRIFELLDLDPRFDEDLYFNVKIFLEKYKYLTS